MTSDGASWAGLMRDFLLEIRFLFQFGRKSLQKSSIKRKFSVILETVNMTGRYIYI